MKFGRGGSYFELMEVRSNDEIGSGWDGQQPSNVACVEERQTRQELP
jgi:hypothetical protein